MAKLLFLSTNSFATNPRLYKEIVLAIRSGYQVQVICFEFDNWSKPLNDAMKKELGNTSIISIPAGRNPFLPWLNSVIVETTFRLLGRLISLPLPALSQAVSRRSNLLIKALDKVSTADWVIGHNPGALWPTAVAGKRFSCKTAFDVEDYHPGEGNGTYLQRLSKQLMKGVLPEMRYVSFASPMIQQAMQQDIGMAPAQWFTLLNYFPAEEFSIPVTVNEGPVKLVWFSQNISYGRGLELITPFFKRPGVDAELHLFGNMDEKFFQQELKNLPNLFLHDPLPQKELHRQLAGFDIGLALDIPVDANREIALTNKILAYLQAGLFVLATDTTAQSELLAGLPGHGYCFGLKQNNSATVMEKIIGEINAIRNSREWRYQHFSSSNWETASLKLLQTWENG